MHQNTAIAFCMMQHARPLKSTTLSAMMCWRDLAWIGTLGNKQCTNVVVDTALQYGTRVCRWRCIAVWVSLALHYSMVSHNINVAVYTKTRTVFVFCVITHAEGFHVHNLVSNGVLTRYWSIAWIGTIDPCSYPASRCCCRLYRVFKPQNMPDKNTKILRFFRWSAQHVTDIQNARQRRARGVLVALAWVRVRNATSTALTQELPPEGPT